MADQLPVDVVVLIRDDPYWLTKGIEAVIGRLRSPEDMKAVIFAVHLDVDQIMRLVECHLFVLDIEEAFIRTGEFWVEEQIKTAGSGCSSLLDIISRITSGDGIKRVQKAALKVFTISLIGEDLIRLIQATERNIFDKRSDILDLKQGIIDLIGKVRDQQVHLRPG